MLSLITRVIENKLAKASLVLVIIQGITLVASFFGNILLAKVFHTAAGYGEFNYYFSIITTLGYSATFGLDTFIIKKNTELTLAGSNAVIYEVIRKSLIVTLCCSFTIATITYMGLSRFMTQCTHNHLLVFLGIIITGVLVIRSFSLRSIGELIYSNFFNQSAKTLIFYIVVLIVYTLWSFDYVNVGVLCFVVASIICFLSVEFLYHKYAEKTVLFSNSLSYKHLLISGLPFFIYDLLGNLSQNIDIFVVEYLSNDYLLGNYSFYKKLSLIPFLAISVVGSVLQTRYIELFNIDNEALQRLIFKSNKLIVIFSLIGCIFIIMAYHLYFEQYFLQYAGFEYFMYVLCASEIICATFGPNTYFMLMLNMEKISVVINILFITLMVLLGVVFYEIVGVDAFLISYALCRIGKNVMTWFYIKKRTQISFFVL